jgi:hypothetical protein
MIIKNTDNTPRVLEIDMSVVSEIMVAGYVIT